MKTFTPEQIAMAALAAGYTLHQHGKQVCIYPPSVTTVPWEPWWSAHDSHRLMVDAGIVTIPMADHFKTMAYPAGQLSYDVTVHWEEHDGDKHAATMHAIMGAAIVKGTLLAGVVP